MGDHSPPHDGLGSNDDEHDHGGRTWFVGRVYETNDNHKDRSRVVGGLQKDNEDDNDDMFFLRVVRSSLFVIFFDDCLQDHEPQLWGTPNNTGDNDKDSKHHSSSQQIHVIIRPGQWSQ